MQIHYLEVVTSDVDAVCTVYAAANGGQFGAPDARLGNARTAVSPDGMRVGIRAPMHGSEAPVVRPYWLVSNLEVALAAAVQAGATVVVPPMPIPDYGRCAIYAQGGTQHGLWQV
jgi:uncharacterized protein